MDTLQTNTTIISAALCVESQKLWRWYRDSLSGFTEKESQDALHKHDFIVQRGSGKEVVRVPILKPENIGANMAIDEKQIGEEMHTVLSNRDTGKIAMLVESIRVFEIQKAIASIGTKADSVVTVTRDMSPVYKKFIDETFFNASQIADKFHIISMLLEACQAVRVRYRQEILRERRIKYDEHKRLEKDSVQNGEKHISSRTFYTMRNPFQMVKP